MNPAIWNLIFNNYDKTGTPLPVWAEWIVWGGIGLIIILLIFMLIQMIKMW